MAKSSAKGQKLLFVTGKGGVGKSFLAENMARTLSSLNKKTLLVGIGDTPGFSHLKVRGLGHVPVKIDDLLDVAWWEGHNCLREYIGHFVKMTSMVNLFFDNKAMRSLIDAAPALNELSIMGKLTSGIRNIGPPLPYEVIVVDAFATGHFKALINAPIGMEMAISGGPMGREAKHIAEVFRDKRSTRILLASLPEELPVNETLELSHFLKDTYSQDPVLLLNKCIGSFFTDEEMQKVEQEKSTNSNLIELTRFIKRQKDREKYFSEKLKQDGNYFELPFQFSSSGEREKIYNICGEIWKSL